MLKKIYQPILDFIDRSRYYGIIIAIITFFIISLFSFSNIYKRVELNLYDLRFGLKPAINEWDRLVFLDIDENSIMSIGEFPWPRNKYGEGLESIKKLGVTLSSFDILFPDNSPLSVNSEAFDRVQMKYIQGKNIDLDDMNSVIKNNDITFGKAIRSMNRVILPFTFDPDPLSDEERERLKDGIYSSAIEKFKKKASVKVPKEKEHYYKNLIDPGTKSILYPIPEIMNNTYGFGFVNRYPDIDGTTRKVKLAAFYKGRLYFNLSLLILSKACNVSLQDIEVIPGKKIILKNGFNPMTFEKKDIVIPIDDDGMMYVNWAKNRRRDTFNVLPFYVLLEYEKLKNSIYRFFYDTENQLGEKKLKKHNRKLNKLFAEYKKAGKAAEKKVVWEKIINLKTKITKIKKDYTRGYVEDITALEKEFKKNKDPGIRQDLETLKNELDAINLVIKVEDELPGKITITGLTAAGSHDIGSIPNDKEFARVGTFFNTINTIINNSHIHKLSGFANYLLMFLIAVFMGFFIQRLNAKLSVIAIAASFILINIIAILSFTLFQVWIEQLGVSLSLLLPSLSIASVKFLKEENQKKFIKNAFSRYIAPGVIDKIIKNPKSLELGGESRIITIYFSDVAGFSTISESKTPKQLVSLLNEYLSEMTNIILDHGGTVDKYEGDAIMAFYGAPHHFEDHALRACMASIDMKKRLREMQDEWKKRGEDVLYVRMGMNSGEAVVGNMGSRARMDYTAMGDSVNLASRLEGANKHYSTSAMMSQSTYEDAKDHIDVRKLDRIRVVGKTVAVIIYELLGKKGQLPDRMYEMLEKYNRGMEYFELRDWKKAKQLFNQGLKIIPDDGPGKTYIQRCKEFTNNPPSKKWDGVYTFKTK